MATSPTSPTSPTPEQWEQAAAAGVLPSAHPITGYAREYPMATWEGEHPESDPKDVGCKTERRFIPIDNGEWQEGAIYAMIRCEHDTLAMSLITIAMQNPGRLPPWAHIADWQAQLYGALTQTMWVDRRDPYNGEYGRSMREAGALVAMLDSITGGRPGGTYMNHYCGHRDGTSDEPENKMAEYLRGLGFKTADYPWAEKRMPRGGHKDDTPSPAFCLLPQVLQEAITLYCGGTEGLARFAMKLAPATRWRVPSPSPMKSKEHEAYNLMKKRDREGYQWAAPEQAERKRPRSATA